MAYPVEFSHGTGLDDDLGHGQGGCDGKGARVDNLEPAAVHLREVLLGGVVGVGRG